MALSACGGSKKAAAPDPSNTDQTSFDIVGGQSALSPGYNDNEVLINIWNWNSDWTLSVVDENRKTLPYTEVWAYDPLHIAALSVKRFNNAGLKSTPSFITDKFTHFFKVDDADTDLVITVKDEFGNEWTENMQRPKAFSTDAYRRK